MIYLLYRVCVVVLFILMLPFYIVIAMCIALTDGVPILFSQMRIGKDGKPFRLYKFRTMVRGAEGMQKKYLKLNIAHGPVFKIYDDPRFTGIGRWLAHTGLDELPQLWNVLRGDMALFGPRPLPVSEERKLQPWQKERERVKPGIMSPWVLEGYHETPFNEWMKSDIAYAREKNFRYDIQLFFRSLPFLWALVK